jgi:hypothetical protein
MARTDDDTWDLASSVGATATMVAAQRALSNREGLIETIRSPSRWCAPSASTYSFGHSTARSI